MIVFPNGHEYKLVYIDTNTINEISKNTKMVGKNFLEKYMLSNTMLVTSAFNIYEISKANGNSLNNILNIFNVLPLGVIHTFPQLIEFEKIKYGFQHEMIMFATGIKPLFNVQINDLISNMKNNADFINSISIMMNRFENEKNICNKKLKKTKWKDDFKNNLLLAMNETFKQYDNFFEIKELNRFFCLEVYAYIRNNFVNVINKEIEINDIIDSYNASVLPYVDVYITEKRVASWLEEAKSKLLYLKNKDIIKISEFYDK